MAADFFFNKPTFEIQPLESVAVFKWKHLKNPDVQYSIAAEEQYLNFHCYMLSSLRHTKAGCLSNPPYAYELGLSVRAGAIKAAILVAASIAEAALRAHAELREYPLNKDPKRRTFGNVIRAWETDSIPHADVERIWSDIKAIHEVRNFVHLHKAAGSSDSKWQKVLSDENALLGGALKAIEVISQLES